jgi:hypothetical protein
MLSGFLVAPPAVLFALLIYGGTPRESRADRPLTALSAKP